MSDLNDMRHPRSDDPKPVKLVLSGTARDLLRGYRRLTGHDMSTIVDWLIRSNLPNDDAATASATQETPDGKDDEDFLRDA